MGEFEVNNTGFNPRRIVGSHGKLYLEGPDGLFDLPGPTTDHLLTSLRAERGATRLPVEQSQVTDATGLES